MTPGDRRGVVGRLASWLGIVRRMSWSERRLLLHAGFVVSVMSLSLKVVSFQRLRNVLLKLGGSTDRARATGRAGQTDPGAEATRIAAIARSVSMWSRHTPVSSTCLHRSLALWWLLRRHGIDSQLQFGARKREGVFEAHAWVEHDGAVVSDDQADGFVRLPWAPLKNDA